MKSPQSEETIYEEYKSLAELEERIVAPLACRRVAGRRDGSEFR